MVLELLQEHQGLLLMLQGPLRLLRNSGRQPVEQQHPAGQAVCVWLVRLVMIGVLKGLWE